MPNWGNCIYLKYRSLLNCWSLTTYYIYGVLILNYLSMGMFVIQILYKDSMQFFYKVSFMRLGKFMQDIYFKISGSSFLSDLVIFYTSTTIRHSIFQYRGKYMQHLVTSTFQNLIYLRDYLSWLGCTNFMWSLSGIAQLESFWEDSSVLCCSAMSFVRVA